MPNRSQSVVDGCWARLCSLQRSALLVAALGLWAAGSVNAGAGPPVQSAGPNLNLSKAPGNQYETAAAINPNNNNQVFVVSRNEVGGLYAARSSDGGINWISRLIASKPVPLPGELPRAYGNPSVAWDSRIFPRAPPAPAPMSAFRSARTAAGRSIPQQARGRCWCCPLTHLARPCSAISRR